VPAADAPVVERLKDAGAIVFAKTNLPLWSGDGQTWNELFGATGNPWDLERSPGGSSGGAAAAIACGFSALETGTDIGGSIRGPAHVSGVYGHKPSFGLVPGTGYFDRPDGGRFDVDINVIGPLTRSVDDLELALGELAGPTPGGPGPYRPTAAPGRRYPATAPPSGSTTPRWSSSGGQRRPAARRRPAHRRRRPGGGGPPADGRL
jgi:amidase